MNVRRTNNQLSNYPRKFPSTNHINLTSPDKSHTRHFLRIVNLKRIFSPDSKHITELQSFKFSFSSPLHLEDFFDEKNRMEYFQGKLPKFRQKKQNNKIKTIARAALYNRLPQNQFHTLSHVISPELYTLERTFPIYLQGNTRSHDRIRNSSSIPLYNRVPRVVFKSIVQEQREAEGMVALPSPSRGGQKRPKIGFETDTSNRGKTDQLDLP